MTVLLTGGAGFIGQHLARHLAAVRYEVAAVDLLHRQVHADPDAARRAFPGPVVVGDVADRSVWTTAAAQVRRVEALVHLAAETGTGQSMYEVDRYHRVNVDGTRRAAEFAVGHGIPLVVHELAGRLRRGALRVPRPPAHLRPPVLRGRHPTPSREDDPHHPVSVYGETKSLGGVGRHRRLRRPRAADDRAPAERHRPRPGAAQPLHRRARRLPRDAPRGATRSASTATATRPATSCTSTTSPRC